MNIFTKNTIKNRKEIFAALDIGTSKVCCAIAKIENRTHEKGGEVLRLIGVGHQSSKGIKGGHIVDLEALEDSILNAVHSAEQMAGQTISEVCINLPASSVQSQTFESHVSIANQTVDETHIRRLLTIGRNAQISEDQQIIHALPISYSIDNTHGIHDPRGMVGNQLSVTIHLVTVPKMLIRNFQNCIGRCHLDISNFVVTPYASGLSTLVDDELTLGATVIDMGGGTTTIASFLDGTLIHIDSLPIGGAHVTSDIARGISTPLVQAERLKTLYGTVVLSSSDERESIVVPQLGENQEPQTHQISKSMLTHIVRARIEETLELIWKRIASTGMDRLVCQRIILTGGGSQLPGIREMAATLWGRQVRQGQPLGVIGASDFATNPMFSTCAGLLQYSWRDYTGSQNTVPLESAPAHFWQRVATWVKENF
ncbi:MAG: cell division protein FtsA [Alphaproteobacteria bacterium]|nr:cell division protein FtsA [Alphaproteobacteria bacterium]